MQYLGLIFIVLMYFPITITNKLSANETENKLMLFKYSAFRSVLGIVVGVISFVLSGAQFKMDLSTWLISALFGVMLAVCMLMTFYAMQVTTLTTVYIFTIAATIIPCIVGAAFFNDTLTLLNLFGLIILFVSLYLIVGNAGGEKKKFGAKALAACLAVFVTSGLGDVSAQLFANCTKDVSEAQFMLLSYVIQAVILIAAFYVVKIKNKVAPEQKISFKMSKKLIICAVIGIAVTFIAQQVLAVLAGMLPAIVLFPFKSGSSIIVASVVGFVLFKEKLTVKNIIGIIASIIAIVFINAV